VQQRPEERGQVPHVSHVPEKIGHVNQVIDVRQSIAAFTLLVLVLIRRKPERADKHA
jgi:hypothetical protein